MRPLLPKDLTNQNLSALQVQLVLCRVAAVKRPTVHHHSADYIFSDPFGSNELIFSPLKNSVPLKLVLGGVAGVAHFITGHEQTQ